MSEPGEAEGFLGAQGFQNTAHTAHTGDSAVMGKLIGFSRSL